MKDRAALHGNRKGCASVTHPVLPEPIPMRCGSLLPHSRNLLCSTVHQLARKTIQFSKLPNSLNTAALEPLATAQ